MEQVLILSPSKIKEWRDWGKQAYKSCASMMKNNSHHPDYDTQEKREAIHNANELGLGQSAYNFTEEGMARLKSRWGYSDNAIKEAKNEWIDGYKASRKWYARADQKQKAVLDRYATIFEEASKIAFAVNVSDIKDGFPCGSAHVYLDYAERNTELGKALAHFNNSSTPQYKYKIDIKFPTYGQCINFDERICGEVVQLLRSKGVLANTYSWID